MRSTSALFCFIDFTDLIFGAFSFRSIAPFVKGAPSERWFLWEMGIPRAAPSLAQPFVLGCRFGREKYLGMIEVFLPTPPKQGFEQAQTEFGGIPSICMRA